jgi:superfamily II DNA or RNA helicase
MVVGGDGNPVAVEGVFDRGHQPGFSVTTDDGVSIDVDADHLWTVATDLDISRGVPWRTVDTATLAGSVEAPGRKRWRIPVTAHHGGESNIPLDPYILGVLLGDGHMSAGQVGFVSADEEIVALVKERLPSGVEIRIDQFEAKPNRYRLVGSEFRRNPALDAVRSLGVSECRSWEKFIPESYLRSNEDDRRALLAGLMDTDGWVGSAQQFTSVSERLANDVAYLVRSLGGVARISRKSSFLDGVQHRDAFNVTIRMDRCPFWLSRKVDRWHEVPRLGATRKLASIIPIEGGIHSVCIKVVAEDGLFITEGFVVTHNTHIALATAAVLFEEGEIDHVLFVCEQNKVQEWAADIQTFTGLSMALYRGSPARRLRLLTEAAQEGTQALVMTYQTAREDLARYRSKKGGGNEVAESGPLLDALMGKRLLVVYDEMTVLAGRTSKVHIGHKRAVQQWGARVLGLTATPVSKNPESFYNLGRILCPEAVGTIESFERDHVAKKNQWHIATHFKNHDLLAEKMSSVLLRKRKTDPDVRDQFPRTVDDFVVLRLDDEHQALYDELADLIADLPEDDARFGFDMLRRFANHPRSILHANGKMAEEFLAMHSRAEFESLRCVKSDAIVEQIRRIVSQDDQVVVFCDSTGVLVELAEDIEQKVGVSVGHYHGRVSESEREVWKTRFKAGEVPVLLCSSAGERGINLPEASYIINYDVPLLHSSYLQRINRASRIGSREGEILVVKTYVADGTVENGSVALWNRRNDDSDKLIDIEAVEGEDEAFVSAQARMALLQQARQKGRAA